MGGHSNIALGGSGEGLGAVAPPLVTCPSFPVPPQGAGAAG